MPSGPNIAFGPGMLVGKAVAFRVRKEGWNRYTAFNGRLEVGLRIVLVAVADPDRSTPAAREQFPPGVVICSFNPMVTIFAAPEFRGTPDKTPVTTEQVEQQGVDFALHRQEEFENEYTLIGNPERILVTRVIATGAKILKGHYDVYGNPILSVPNQTLISPTREAGIDELAE